GMGKAGQGGEPLQSRDGLESEPHVRQRRDVIGHRVLPLRRLELYVLRAVPQAQAPEFGKLVEVGRQGDEMVAGELAELAGEMDAAIGEQDLRLADAAGIEDHLARRGVGGVILIPDAELQIAEGY